MNLGFNIHFRELGGAVVFPDMIETICDNGEKGWKVPAVNKEYCQAILDTENEVLWASKDGKQFVMALSVELCGQMWTARELLATPRRKKNDRR